jgi:hypothetical protein
LDEPQVLDEDHVAHRLEEKLGILTLLGVGRVIVDVMRKNALAEHASTEIGYFRIIILKSFTYNSKTKVSASEFFVT